MRSLSLLAFVAILWGSAHVAVADTTHLICYYKLKGEQRWAWGRVDGKDYVVSGVWKSDSNGDLFETPEHETELRTICEKTIQGIDGEAHFLKMKAGNTSLFSDYSLKHTYAKEVKNLKNYARALEKFWRSDLLPLLEATMKSDRYHNVLGDLISQQWKNDLESIHRRVVNGLETEPNEVEKRKYFGIEPGEQIDFWINQFKAKTDYDVFSYPLMGEGASFNRGLFKEYTDEAENLLKRWSASSCPETDQGWANSISNARVFSELFGNLTELKGILDQIARLDRRAEDIRIETYKMIMNESFQKLKEKLSKLREPSLRILSKDLDQIEKTLLTEGGAFCFI